MDLDELLGGIRPMGEPWVQKAREYTSRLVMPHRALGRLHDIAERLCGIQQTLTPSVDRKVVLIMAGDHGVVDEGVSAFPQEVTGEMVRTFLRGGAGINVLADRVDARVCVVDMGVVPDLDPALLQGGDRLRVHKVARGTANFVRGPAMTRKQATEAVLTGFQQATECIQAGAELLGTGDMGIGNTTSSAAIGTVLTRKDLDQMVGRGTGIDDEGLRRKRAIIQKGIQRNRPNAQDGLDVLSKLGGFEIGGIAGCVLAGAYHRVPVVIDGLISTAGALVAHSLCLHATDYLFAGHRSAEPGHRAMLAHLGLEPILQLDMRLGEGSGAALAMGIVQAAVHVHRDVLTFQQAGISGKGS